MTTIIAGLPSNSISLCKFKVFIIFFFFLVVHLLCIYAHLGLQHNVTVFCIYRLVLMIFGQNEDF